MDNFPGRGEGESPQDRPTTLILRKSKNESRQSEISFKGLPSSIGGYPILQEIGRGGMGVVYKAKDPGLNRELALKVLLGGIGADEHTSSRFIREAQTLAELSHSSIVKVYDLGSDRGQLFFTMDLLEGLPFDQYLLSADLELAQKIELIEKICNAVGAAHEKGIVHRDLKPGNIHVTLEGHPMIFDFGIAHFLGTKNQDLLTTKTGEILGTPNFMAPEQVKGHSGEIDPRTDVYALGIILYQTVTGSLPYLSGQTYESLKAVVEKDPDPPSTLVPDLPKDLELIILKAIHKEKSHRYPNAQDLAADLRNFLQGKAVGAHPDAPLYLIKKWIKRKRKILIGALLMTLVFFPIVLWLEKGRQEANKAYHIEQNKFLDRKKADKFLAKATTYLQQNMYPEALKSLEKALDITPDYVAAHILRGNLLEKTGHLEEALKAFKIVCNLKPNSAWGHLKCGDILSAKTMHKEAMAAYNRALAADPDLAEAYFGRGSIYLTQNKMPEAKAAFFKAISINPDYDLACYGLGRVLEQLEEYNHALMAFKSALRKNPNFAKVHYHRGKILMAQGKTNESHEALNLALKNGLSNEDKQNCEKLLRVLKRIQKK